MNKKKIVELELLAPAKNAAYGKTAIDCGADAVYIGASHYGARMAASNSVEDIAILAQYAHIFGAKVYATLNTLLFNDELLQVQQLAEQLWEAGVDALIVQDMAFLEMQLPPLPLFASTQTFNLSPERIHFLEQAGFSRVILERAVSLSEIREIRSSSSLELEAFVHGAICVSYSGQCYMSQVVAGRSGNRGVCAQPCRSSYHLVDQDGKVLLKNKHLLSVKDLCLNERMDELLDAGITSFKIEGRLKDEAYLKNIVSYYDRKLNTLIENREGFCRSSAGKSRMDYQPVAEKTFSRGFTDYCLTGLKRGLSSFETPKSIGERMGKVRETGRDFFLLDPSSPAVWHNGDGICFTDNQGSFRGTNINRVEGSRIYPNRMDGIQPGISIFRNSDLHFLNKLERLIPVRTLATEFRLVFAEKKVVISVRDETGTETGSVFDVDLPAAQKPQQMSTTIKKQFSKTGDSVFHVTDVAVEGEVPFVSVSVLNGWRRQMFELLTQARRAAYRRPGKAEHSAGPLVWKKHLTWGDNVTNELSEKFYRRAGAERIEPGFDVLDAEDYTGKEVMRTRYCLRRELGKCLAKTSGKDTKKWYLENNGNRFRLNFDCGACEMAVVFEGKPGNRSLK